MGGVIRGLACRAVVSIACMSREVIAVNQDPLGVQGKLVSSGLWVGQDKLQVGDGRVYSRPLSNHSVAVALLNTHSFSYPHNITFTFNDVRNNSTTKQFSDPVCLSFQVGFTSSRGSIRDLFAQKDLGTFSGSFTGSVNPTGVRLLKLTPA